MKEILVKFCNLIVNIDRSSLGYISDGRDHVCVFFSVEGNPLLERELYEGYDGVWERLQEIEEEVATDVL